jgi:hypothetical protein
MIILQSVEFTIFVLASQAKWFNHYLARLLALLFEASRDYYEKESTLIDTIFIGPHRSCLVYIVKFNFFFSKLFF